MSETFVEARKREEVALEFWYACKLAAAFERLEVAELVIEPINAQKIAPPESCSECGQWEHIARYFAFGMLNMPRETFDYIVKREREAYIAGEHK